MAKPFQLLDADLFQSSSSPKAGCNMLRCISAANLTGVSILIQPEGRMQLAQLPIGVVDQRVFQSSSSPKAGCNSWVRFFYSVIANLPGGVRNRTDGV